MELVYHSIRDRMNLKFTVPTENTRRKTGRILCQVSSRRVVAIPQLLHARTHKVACFLYQQRQTCLQLPT